MDLESHILGKHLSSWEMVLIMVDNSEQAAFITIAFSLEQALYYRKMLNSAI